MRLPPKLLTNALSLTTPARTQSPPDQTFRSPLQAPPAMQRITHYPRPHRSGSDYNPAFSSIDAAAFRASFTASRNTRPSPAPPDLSASWSPQSCDNPARNFSPAYSPG